MTPLEQRLSGLLEKRRAQSKLRTLKASPNNSVDFSSNDFLSLSTNSEFRQSYIEELEQADLPIGSTGSRLLDGNSCYAESLEARVAHFHGAEAGLLTNSGFDANVSLFTCLPQPGDVVVYDELIHASVHDGMRQTRASRCVPFKHNSVEDLRDVLQPFVNVKPSCNVFVAVETVYSMEGDLAPLREITDLVETMFPHKNAHIIVDEAHATGVYGPNGSGRVCELGLEKRIFARLHTFGKAMSCNGAIILCSPTVRLYLINYARPLIYTTFMSYPSLAGIKVGYDWLESGRTLELASDLWSLIRACHQRLRSLDDLRLNGASARLVSLAGDQPQSPILALLTPYPRQLAAHCQKAGFMVRPVVPPTVPEGTERVRVCLHSGNTLEEIEDLVRCITTWVLSSSTTEPLLHPHQSLPIDQNSNALYAKL